MTYILGTKQTFRDADDAVAMEFLETVCDITALPEYQQLKQFRHHYGTTRYQHCLNVAWYTFLWCRNRGLNYRSAARGAMLHDFYLYDHHKEQPFPGSHAEVHPRAALSNALKFFDPDAIMIDCIVNHMWPGSPHRPATPEGLIVTIADKYCASLEFGTFAARKGLRAVSVH
ncbi:MAG: HD domain-containing protein [Solobacterium sp.]|nr:HD domain-containing protein [Solobacterium sp.]